ncbi:MAG: hypothetical protein K5774_09000 [Clostridia bacterium]|nr:hypothetical protein [Clostridia bacterium]
MQREHALRILAALALVLVLAAGTMPGTSGAAYAASPVTITEQPHDVTVTCPEGAEFRVEVDHPENVASYQWELSDGSNLFVMNGKTATTDTLYIPGTNTYNNSFTIHCVITDLDGNQTVSDDAVLSYTNWHEEPTVLYVGEFGVQPGETFDLAGAGMGSGTVEFDADGVNVTFTDFKFNNELIYSDAHICDAMGILLEARHSEVPEYYLHFKGDCVIDNSFYDPDYNAAGVTFNSFFQCGDSGNKPTIIIDGDGLTLKGGSNAIYSDGNIEIACELHTEPNEHIFHDSITCFNLYVDENVKVQLRAQGTGILTKGDARFYPGSVTTIYSEAPHVSVGPTTKSLVKTAGSMYLDKAELNIDGNANPDQFVPYGAYLVNLNGIDCEAYLNADASKINVLLSAMESDEFFAMNYIGIVGGDENTAFDFSNGSEVSVIIDCPEVVNGTGLYQPEKIVVEGGSSLSVEINTAGEASGIEADRSLTVTDSLVEAKVASADKYSEAGVEGTTYGIVCGLAEISLSKPDYKVHSLAENGLAFAADTGERTEEPVEYVKDYAPQFIVLGEGTEILLPEKSEISLCGVPGYGTTIKAEAVYDSADTSVPAQEVVFGSGTGGSGGALGKIWAPIAVVVGIALIALVVRAFKGSNK